MHLSSDGIVLRDFQRDEDRILTILTRKYGVLTAFANKANRPRSALASSTELLCHSDFEIFSSRDRNTVDRADSMHGFFRLRSRMEDLALACWLAQMMQELAPQQESADHYINLLFMALYFLEKQTRPPRLIKAAFELRLLTLAGYMPDLVACADCGQVLPGGMYFQLDGTLHCRDCQPASIAGRYPVTDGVLAAMRHCIYAEEAKIFSFQLSPQGMESLANISEAFVLHQIEKTFPALEFYRTLVVE